MRDFSAANKNALRQRRISMCFLIHIEIAKPGATTINLYMSTASHSIVHSVGPHINAEWLGAGRMMDLEFGQEDTSLEIHNAEITLNGLDPALISLALSEPLEHAPVTIYLLMIDPDLNTPVDTATQFMRGTMSNIRIVPPTSDSSNQ